MLSCTSFYIPQYFRYMGILFWVHSYNTDEYLSFSNLAIPKTNISANADDLKLKLSRENSFFKNEIFNII